MPGIGSILSRLHPELFRSSGADAELRILLKLGWPVYRHGSLELTLLAQSMEQALVGVGSVQDFNRWRELVLDSLKVRQLILDEWRWLDVQSPRRARLSRLDRLKRLEARLSQNKAIQSKLKAVYSRDVMLAIFFCGQRETQTGSFWRERLMKVLTHSKTMSDFLAALA